MVTDQNTYLVSTGPYEDYEGYGFFVYVNGTEVYRCLNFYGSAIEAREQGNIFIELFEKDLINFYKKKVEKHV